MRPGLLAALPGLCCLSLVAAQALAQAPAPAARSKGISVMTRLVTELAPLEQELAAGASAERLDALLDPAFLERHASGEVLGREPAMHRMQAAAGARPAAEISELQVHEVGEVALAEYRRPGPGKRPDVTQGQWVMDAWRRDAQGQWRLRLRFVAPLAGHRPAPGAPSQTPRVPPYGPGAPTPH